MSADVSIVITSYNIERYIERAIASALSQQDVAVEVIVVDDASSDGTWAVATGISDPRLKCIRLEKNSGPSVARNTGFAAASSPWIAVLDGDDSLEPKRMARCLARAKDQGADIVVDNLTMRREADGAAFVMFPDFHIKTLTLASFIGGNASFLGGWTLGYLKPVFSAAFLKAHTLSYDPAIRIGEDYIFLAETLASGAGCSVEPTAGYNYTVRAGSISHRLTLGDVERIAAADMRFLSRYKLEGAASYAQKRREARLLEAKSYTLLVDALKRMDVMAACRAAVACPACLSYLWMPLWARMKRACGHD